MNFTSNITSNGTEFVTPGFVVSVGSLSNLIVGSLMTLATIAGQIMVFIVVYHDNRLREASNLYIASLAMADLLLAVFSMPVWTIYHTLGYWPLPRYMCDIWNSGDVILTNVSILTIFYIALDRCLCLNYPFTYPLWRTDKVSLVALFLLWLAPVIHYGSIVGTTQVVLGANRDENDCLLYYADYVGFVLYINSMTFWIPIFGTVGVYIVIYRIAAKVAAAQKSLKPTAINAVSSDNGPSSGSEPPAMKEDDLKALKSIGLLLITFIICWFPLSIVFSLHVLWSDFNSPPYFVFTYWMGYFNSTLNPLCYALGNPYFKETLKKLLSGKLRS